MNINTPSVDTLFLYTFSYLSGIFLLLGIAFTYKIPNLIKIESELKDHILYVYFILVILIPLCFKIFGIRLIRNSVTKKLKRSKCNYNKDCPNCGEKQVLCENTVLDWNDLRIFIHCNKCSQENGFEIRTKMKIG